MYNIRISTPKHVHHSVRCHGGYVTCIWQSAIYIYIYIYIYIFVHCGCIPSPISHVHILLLWYTLSSLFAALTHSLIVYCPHSSPHLLTQCVLSSLFSALTQCLLPSLFTVLTQLACPVSNIHSLRCLSVYCPNSSLHCLT